MKVYKAKWAKKRKLGDTDPNVEVLHPLLIGETMDSQVKAYIGDSGGPSHCYGCWKGSSTQV